MHGSRQVLNLRGEQGSLAISDTDTHTGSWATFQVVADAVLTSIVMPKEAGDVADYAGVTYPQGYVFYGPITAITLASGVVQMHNFVDPSRKSAQESM